MGFVYMKKSLKQQMNHLLLQGFSENASVLIKELDTRSRKCIAFSDCRHRTEDADDCSNHRSQHNHK